MKPDRLLTIPEAAHRLGVSRATLYSHLAAGRIEALKIGGATRIRDSELDRVITDAPRLKTARMLAVEA